MTTTEKRRIIVVLGSGRSGTSLLMQVLNRLGMDISDNLALADEQNTMGSYEDYEIFSRQTKILRKTCGYHWFPLEKDWFKKANIEVIRNELENIIAQKIEESKNIFGFKDPRTSLFLLMWIRIFNKLKIVPRYILTVRNPASVISSMQRQYNWSDSQSELSWLNRNVEAIRQLGANCYIVHYEDWFLKSEEIAAELLEYTELKENFHEDSISKTLEGVIKENLNRSIYEDYQVKNKYVIKLYDALKKCKGKDFERAMLMQTVKECQNAMHGFRGWYQHAQILLRKVDKLSNEIKETKEFSSDKEKILEKNEEKITTCENKINELEAELKKIVIENNKLLKENKNLVDMEEILKKKDENLIIYENKIKELETDLQKMVIENNQLLKSSKQFFDEIESYRKRLSLFDEIYLYKNEKKSNTVSSYQSMKWKKEAIMVRYSYSFRLGQIFFNAITKPGKDTILMPYYLIKLTFDIITGKGRIKAKEALEGNYFRPDSHNV